MMHGVITGPIGVGKSTVVRRVMEHLGWTQPAGFLTRKTVGRPGEVSLYVGTWKGDLHPIAYSNSTTASASVARHRLDSEALVRFAEHHLRNLSNEVPVVLDELGVLELTERRFTGIVADLFQRRGALLAVIQQRALDSWLQIIPADSIHHIYEVSVNNRDTLPRVISLAFQV